MLGASGEGSLGAAVVVSNLALLYPLLVNFWVGALPRWDADGGVQEYLLPLYGRFIRASSPNLFRRDEGRWAPEYFL